MSRINKKLTKSLERLLAMSIAKDQDLDAKQAVAQAEEWLRNLEGDKLDEAIERLELALPNAEDVAEDA